MMNNDALSQFKNQLKDSCIIAYSPHESMLLDSFSTCINCGICITACEVAGATTATPIEYPGPRSIGISLSRSIPEFWTSHEVIFHCTMCGACEAVCPTNIPIPEVVAMLRRKTAQQAPEEVPNSHTAMLRNLVETGNIYGTDLEPIGVSDSHPEFAYFAGCVGVFMEHDSVTQTTKLLKHLGHQVAIIDDLCCGGPCEVGGFDIPQIAINRVVERMESLGVHEIITSCPRCNITFNNTPEYREKFTSRHITEFLSEIDWGQLTDKEITYHDPCELSRHQSITQQPRMILKSIAPNFKEMSHNCDLTACCGAGGGLRGVKTRLSINIARKRLEEAIDQGAEVLVTECYSCLHNFYNARKSADSIEIYNLSEYLYRLIAQDSH